MDWTYPTRPMLRRDAAGLETLLERFAEDAGGTPLRGTRFLSSALEMMQATRMIEDAVTENDHLYVGFQRAEKLRRERTAYDTILERGVRVTAFLQSEYGTAMSSTDPNMRIVEVPRDRRLLANQWFLIVRGPSPVAFVGYDISAPESIGEGGVSNPERHFAGFISDDLRVIESLIADLEKAAATREPLRAPAEAVAVASDAHLIAVMTDDGSDPTVARTRALAIDLAAKTGAGLVYYDRSAESWLVDPYPYPEVVGPERILSWDDVLRLERTYLADQIDQARTQHVIAGAWLPTQRGSRGLKEFAERFTPDLLILPAEMADPSLADRLRGNTLAKIAGAVPTPVMLAEADGSMMRVDPETGETTKAAG